MRFVLLVTAVCFLLPPPARAADRPNIVFILADDLGYGDVGSHRVAGVGGPRKEAVRWKRLVGDGGRC